MIKYNTRFNPTVNGYLHLGHLYMMLVNQAEAAHSGGRFLIRFDDSQHYWTWLHTPGEIACYKSEMRADIQWLNIGVDGWSSQNDMLCEVDRLLDEIDFPLAGQPFCSNYFSEVIGLNLPLYPFTERLTGEKVILDFLQEITWLIRGYDLLTEDGLYRYFVQHFELIQPRMTYIPRLIFDGDAISKSAGRYKLRDYRMSGIDPTNFLLPQLAADCLICPSDPWLVDNIKPRPILGKWAAEALCHS